MDENNSNSDYKNNTDNKYSKKIIKQEKIKPKTNNLINTSSISSMKNLIKKPLDDSQIKSYLNNTININSNNSLCTTQIKNHSLSRIVIKAKNDFSLKNKSISKDNKSININISNEQSNEISKYSNCNTVNLDINKRNSDSSNKDNSTLIITKPSLCIKKSYKIAKPTASTEKENGNLLINGRIENSNKSSHNKPQSIKKTSSNLRLNYNMILNDSSNNFVNKSHNIINITPINNREADDDTSKASFKLIPFETFNNNSNNSSNINFSSIPNNYYSISNNITSFNNDFREKNNSNINSNNNGFCLDIKNNKDVCYSIDNDNSNIKRNKMVFSNYVNYGNNNINYSNNYNSQYDLGNVLVFPVSYGNTNINYNNNIIDKEVEEYKMSWNFNNNIKSNTSYKKPFSHDYNSNNNKELNTLNTVSHLSQIKDIDKTLITDEEDFNRFISKRLTDFEKKMCEIKNKDYENTSNILNMLHNTNNTRSNNHIKNDVNNKSKSVNFNLKNNKTATPDRVSNVNSPIKIGKFILFDEKKTDSKENFSRNAYCNNQYENQYNNYCFNDTEDSLIKTIDNQIKHMNRSKLVNNNSRIIDDKDNSIRNTNINSTNSNNKLKQILKETLFKDNEEYEEQDCIINNNNTNIHGNFNNNIYNNNTNINNTNNKDNKASKINDILTTLKTDDYENLIIKNLLCNNKDLFNNYLEAHELKDLKKEVDFNNRNNRNKKGVFYNILNRNREDAGNNRSNEEEVKIRKVILEKEMFDYVINGTNNNIDDTTHKKNGFLSNRSISGRRCNKSYNYNIAGKRDDSMGENNNRNYYMGNSYTIKQKLIFMNEKLNNKRNNINNYSNTKDINKINNVNSNNNEYFSTNLNKSIILLSNYSLNNNNNNVNIDKNINKNTNNDRLNADDKNKQMKRFYNNFFTTNSRYNKEITNDLYGDYFNFIENNKSTSKELLNKSFIRNKNITNSNQKTNNNTSHPIINKLSSIINNDIKKNVKSYDKNKNITLFMKEKFY